MKLEERLKQIEKRISELQRKADWIKSELPSANTNEYAEFQAPRIDIYVEKEHLFDKPEEDAPPVLPRRRGRRKLNETE